MLNLRDILDSQRFQTAEMTFKVVQGHQRPRGLIKVPINVQQ